MLVVIDNYDSFTYNLVQYFGELGENPAVYRNDAITPDDVLALEPAAIVLSPGPCTPNEAGISLDLVRRAAGKVPLLGVCLGHQAIAQALGGRIVRADRLMHGKTSPISHDATPLFEGLPATFDVMRYHSLIVDPTSVPDDLAVTARTTDPPNGTEIMALEHRRWPLYGVQFHPESIGTEVGKSLMNNFLRIAKAWHSS